MFEPRHGLMFIEVELDLMVVEQRLVWRQ
jgi:hypothetical protein